MSSSTSAARGEEEEAAQGWGSSSELEWEDDEEEEEKDEDDGALLAEMDRALARMADRRAADPRQSRKLAREAAEKARAERRSKRRREAATLVARLAVAMRLNRESETRAEEALSVAPEDVRRALGAGDVAGAQSALAWLRRTFRRGSGRFAEALRSGDDPSEFAMCQVLVGCARARGVPARMVFRLTNAVEVAPDDVWVELWLRRKEVAQDVGVDGDGVGGYAWHRAYASVARVLEADEEERTWARRRLAAPGQRGGGGNGVLDPRPRRFESKTGTQVICALGEGNWATLVTRRYSSRPVGRTAAIAAIEKLVKRWNESVTLPEFSRSAMSGRAQQAEMDLFDALDNESTEAALPATLEGFKNSTEVVLESAIGHPNRMIRKGAKPINYFKGQPVFHRREVVTVLNEFGWKKRGRSVVEHELENPIKISPKRTKVDMAAANAATIMVDSDEAAKALMEDEFIDPRRKLYDESQTVAIDPGDVDPETGKIPTNEYGNVELWTESCLPRGAVHLTLDNAHEACKELGIECAGAVVGFEWKDRRSQPKFHGIVIAKANEAMVRQKAAEIKERKDLEKLNQMKKETAERWIQLLEAHWIILNSTLRRTTKVAVNTRQTTESSTETVKTDGKSTENRATSITPITVDKITTIGARKVVEECWDHAFTNGICDYCGISENDIMFF